MKVFLKENWIEVILISASLLWGVSSAFLSSRYPEGNWFSRSGAIILLFSMIVEYKVGVLQANRTRRAITVAGLDIPMSNALSIEKDYLVWTARFFILLGTLIWGYGDLCF